MPEYIPDTDEVSRLLFEPFMRPAGRDDLHWDNIFQFPSDQGACESVVWRAKAPAMVDVHAIGCDKQGSDRKSGRTKSTYFGSITAKVAEIRALRSKGGISITVSHCPDEFEAHAHLAFSDGAKKNDKSELKVLLRAKFGPLSGHTCP